MSINFAKIAVNASQENNDIRNNWQTDEILDLFALPFNDLIFKAATIHRQYHNPNEVQISTLLSIKTGSCPEDCKYCPQSAHYQTNLKKEPFMETLKVVTYAKKAKESGASRFCMGAAWKNLHSRDLDQLCSMVTEVKKIGLETCLTVGMINDHQAKKLKKAGLDYYNHNIDTSEEYYKKIITTRSFEDRLDTLENIRKNNINVCSGGIVGMGEEQKDRAKMIQTLANLPKHPQSVPINLLVKVKGTPLANTKELDIFEFIKTIAIARIAMPKAKVRLSAGRTKMNQQTQSLCFFAGANSIFYGEKLLTTDNPDNIADQELFKKLGITGV